MAEEMRLLVTGASGFIGQNVLLRVPPEWQVFAVYHSTPGLDRFVSDHALTNVTPVRCDLTDAADVRELVRRTGASDASCTWPRTAIPRNRSNGPRGTFNEHGGAGDLARTIARRHFVYAPPVPSTTAWSERSRRRLRSPPACRTRSRSWHRSIISAGSSSGTRRSGATSTCASSARTDRMSPSGRSRRSGCAVR